VHALLAQGQPTPEETAVYFRALLAGDPAAWVIAAAGLAVIAALVWLKWRRDRRQGDAAAGRGKE
jgi:hypothetical protein